MINRIGPGQPQPPGIDSRKAVEKEKPLSLPKDVASLTRETASAEDMRKASIEYYHLHKKDSTPAEEDGKTTSPKVPAKNEKPPRNIPQFETPDVKDAAKKSKGEGHDVGPFEKRLKEELGDLATIQNDWDIDGLKGKIPTLKELQETFDLASKDKEVPWEYLPDGCYARAHVTAKKFLDRGINCAKMYVIIGDAHWDDPGYPFPSWRLRAKGKFTKGEWWYHVAALVFAKDDKGKTDGYIIDPAVNPKKPLKAADWIRAFWSGNFPINFDTTHADVYDPPEQEFGFPVPKEFSQKEFDKWMKLSKTTNQQYSKVLAKIKDQYYEQHPEEKPDDWGERA